MAKKWIQKQLLSIGKEFQKAMDLDPAIDLKLEGDELKEDIIEKAIPFLEAGDEWTELTQAFIDDVAPKEEKKKGKAAPAPAKAKKEEEPEEPEEKPGKGKKAAPAPKEKAKAAPAKKEKKEKEPKTPRYTRPHSFVEALKAGVLDMEKLVVKANKLYVQNGGKDNEDDSRFYVNRCLIVTEALGLTKRSGKGIEFVNAKAAKALGIEVE